MNKQLEDRLAERYPFMRRGNPCEDSGHPEDITDLYAAYGCAIEDGWYSVLDGLCESVTGAYARAGVPVDLKPTQIKEKYGTLRFYITFEGGSELSELHKEIDAIIDRWEAKSSTVCERCGSDGELRPKLDWILTLCNKCYRQRKKELRRNQRQAIARKFEKTFFVRRRT